MRALYEKDIRLILTRKSTLFIFLIIGVIFTWSFSGYFSGAYITALGTVLALSTISFDDFDNCMAFLLTLPCTRKQYVLEKYLFVYGFAFVSGLIGIIIIALSGMVKGNVVNEAMLVEAFASELPIIVITGGLMIPLQLKFGAEKSRIVFMSIVGAVLIAGFMLSKIAFATLTIERINELINGTATIGLLAILIVILVIISVISVLVSSKIMNDKEF